MQPDLPTSTTSHLADPGTVLVTGAAGAIGSAVCRHLAAAGYQVHGWDRAPAPDAAGAEPGWVLSQVDHGDPVAVEAAAAALPARIDHLLLIAGGALPGEATLESAGQLPDPDLFAASVAANLCGTYRVIHAVEPRLAAGGSITVTSSINTVGSYGMPGYTSAKAGLHGLVLTLTKLLGGRDIRVNEIVLGTVRTPRTEALWAHSPDHFDRLNAGAALPQIVNVDQAARTYLALVRDLTAVTGAALTVDAGQSVLRVL